MRGDKELGDGERGRSTQISVRAGETTVKSGTRKDEDEDDESDIQA